MISKVGRFKKKMLAIQYNPCTTMDEYLKGTNMQVRIVLKLQGTTVFFVLKSKESVQNIVMISYMFRHKTRYQGDSLM